MVCHWVLFYGWMIMFAIFHYRSIACEWTCTWSWSWEYVKSLIRVKEFDKTQSKVKLHTRVLSWKSNFGLGRNFHKFEETSYWWFFLKETPITLHGRAWFCSSNHITFINYLDSMGPYEDICSQELERKQWIKSMQVYSWKRMECTIGLARFIDFSYSD